jgi:cytochrome c-type biogenesis protein CcmE
LPKNNKKIAVIVVKTQAEPVGLTFELTDGASTIPVVFQGIPPDLFKEGQGTVAEGHWKDGRVFHSKMIMAKHSEDYMPIEMKRAGVELPKKDFMKTLSP